jgi:hypothetical protein
MYTNYFVVQDDIVHIDVEEFHYIQEVLHSLDEDHSVFFHTNKKKNFDID